MDRPAPETRQMPEALTVEEHDKKGSFALLT